MEIKELRESTGMNRKEFCEYFEIQRPLCQRRHRQKGEKKLSDVI